MKLAGLTAKVLFLLSPFVLLWAVLLLICPVVTLFLTIVFWILVFGYLKMARNLQDQKNNWR